jgi:energy-coupling factor transport system ATP-binding protein
MIRFKDVSFRYALGSPWIVRHLDLEIAEGELVVVVGPTGSGKSTVLAMINGLVPHLSGGQIAGEVEVAGHRTLETVPSEMAAVVGYVGQDPQASFVTDRVEDEIAYAMENLGVEAVAMRRRVEDALDLMNLHEIRDAPLTTLSGGQQQRVAIAAVLAAAPAMLVLDEPTSALDPGAAEEVLHALTRLVHDLGMTVVLAEHRLERVLPFADRVVLLSDDGQITVGRPEEIMERSAIAPPIIELGRLAGWSPLPISVRDARRCAHDLVQELADHVPRSATTAGGDVVATVERVDIEFGPLRALDEVSLELHEGTVTALMGRNGSGKSTLLGVLAGIGSPTRGVAKVAGRDPVGISPAERIRLVGYVPQEPGDLLYAQSVDAECATADSEHGLDPGTTAAVVAGLSAIADGTIHPHDLSEGQRLSLVLGIVLAPRPKLLLLDEPTRGLDYASKHRLVAMLKGLRDEGIAILLATHDVELVAAVADRALVLAQGELIADGPAREVVAQTPAFAPQVAKVLSPLAFLTVEEVAAAL